MSSDTFLYNVKDLNVVLCEQLRTLGEPWGHRLSMEELIHWWYRVELEESLVIFYTRHKLSEEFGADFYNQCIKRVNPILAQWLRKTVRVPPHLLSSEPQRFVVDETDLALHYRPGEVVDVNYSLYR